MNNTEKLNELTELINVWGKLKKESDKLAITVKEYNEKIKQLMVELELDEFETDTFRAIYKLKKSETFNEKKLLVKLKELNNYDCIGTKEYVDMNILESLIYNNELNPADLSECIERKFSQSLTLKTPKKKGESE